MSAVMTFTQRVDADSGVKWVDGRLVPTEKPATVRVSFGYPHPDDECEMVWHHCSMVRSEAVGVLKTARRSGLMRIERSVKGFEITEREEA